jgi:crotonobetainyl-CoA:carnitine CoA-transferase CaiB-like acyl-CoA transferase
MAFIGTFLEADWPYLRQVIKVESMGNPDSARGLGNAPAPGLASMLLHTSRGKQSVMLNLNHRRGVEVALAMAKNCDVVIQKCAQAPLLFVFREFSLRKQD